MTNNTAFDRFNFNFDTSKFGDALEISEGSKQMMDNYANTVPLANWQKQDLANPVTRTNYFKNPVASNCAALVISLQSLSVTANDVSFTQPGAANVGIHLCGNTNLLRIYEVQALSAHADRISGVAEVRPDPTIPTYDGIQALGNQNILILNRTDGIQNSVGALGAMTSLFIGPDLDSYTANVLSFVTEIENNTTTGGGGFPFLFSNTCTLSATRLEQMNTSLNLMKNYLYERRNGDYFFYQTALQTVHDYSFVTKFSSMSNTQSYLIQNYIGTDELKAKLASST
jgi:hypothetical protein